VSDTYDGAQPLPTPNDRPSVHDLVVADVLGRKAFGLAKYGSHLQAHNGRDALRDAYDEALDLCCYLRQEIEERDSLAELLRTAGVGEGQLGLATTRELLNEIRARGETEHAYETLGHDMAIGAASLIDRLPGSMLDYRTAGDD